jgi:hypothetical protein
MPKITKLLSELIPCNYIEEGVSVEPSDNEIRQAIERRDFETRGMDEHQDDIRNWLLDGSNNGQDIDAHRQMVKEYHTKRVAYWVVNEWQIDDPYPITIDSQNNIIAGNHRFRAARYKKVTEVEVMAPA